MMNKKPDFTEYGKSDGKGVKEYIMDTIKWLESRGDKRAVGFDFSVFDTLPVSLWDMSILDDMENADMKDPAISKFMDDVIHTFGDDLWGHMFNGEIDFNDRDKTLENIMEHATKTLRNRIGGSNPVNERLLGPMAKGSKSRQVDELLAKGLETAKEAVYLALQTEHTGPLTHFVTKGRETLVEMKKYEAKGDRDAKRVKDGLEDLLLESENMLELIGMNKDKHDAFYNSLVNNFIDEQIERYNNPKHELGRMQILWKQIYSDETPLCPVKGLVAVVFDLKEKVLRPVAMCLHSGMRDDISEAFGEQLKGEGTEEFVMGKVIDFIQVHKEDALKYVDGKEIGDDGDMKMYMAHVSVHPEVQSPSPSFISSLIEHVSEHVDLDVNDFFKESE